MKAKNSRSWVWGGLLIILGLFLILDQYVGLGAWVWVLGLIVSGLALVGLYLLERTLRWTLIPAYVLLAIGVMVGLITLGVLDDLLIPAYVLFAIAIPFFAVYLRNRSQWWPLIPGGITAIVGLAFLLAEGRFQYIAAVAAIAGGVWLLLSGLGRRGAASGDAGTAMMHDHQDPSTE